MRGRVREGTNRQESTGIDRSRVCPCGARRTRATAQGPGRVDSGAARRDEGGHEGSGVRGRVREGTNRQESTGVGFARAERGARGQRLKGGGDSALGGPARNSIPVDSCRFLSTRLWGGSARRGRARGQRARGDACVRGRIDRSRHGQCNT